MLNWFGLVIHALFCISYSQSFHHKISGKWKSAEEKTANKNFCWHGTVLGNNSYSQSFNQQNLSKVKFCSRKDCE
jgi:hypothetical protein